MEKSQGRKSDLKQTWSLLLTFRNSLAVPIYSPWCQGWYPFTAPIYGPHLQPPFTAPIYGPHLRPPFTAPIYSPHLQPPFTAPGARSGTHLQPPFTALIYSPHLQSPFTAPDAEVSSEEKVSRPMREQKLLTQGLEQNFLTLSLAQWQPGPHTFPSSLTTYINSI